MTTIKTHCPNCGEVSLTPSDIELHIAANVEEHSFYAFDCPSCPRHICKRAGQREVGLLETAGVYPVDRVSKTPVSEKSAISADEVINFFDILRNDDLFRPWLLQLRKLVHEDGDSGL